MNFRVWNAPNHPVFLGHKNNGTMAKRGQKGKALTKEPNNTTSAIALELSIRRKAIQMARDSEPHWRCGKYYT